MFSVMELRLIRHSVQASIEALLQRRATADPESDEAIEITNDLMIYQNILDKISDRPEV